MFVSVMRTTTALLALCLWVHAGACVAQTASKCGVPQVWNPMFYAQRIVGGKQATYGSHPWLVSLRFRGSHFCGGAILTDRWVMTAAHCFGLISKEFLGGMTVAAGEFDRRVDDCDEQVFRVKSVSVHEKYSPVLPMSFDIALVELHQCIKMGMHVQPICLPLPSEKIIPPASSCIVGGWGKIKERGRLPDILREVQLNLMDPVRCKYVLHTVKSPVLDQVMVQPESAMTVLCAGPERGGKDACQGDSGGPLVCLAGSGRGPWVAVGITSWGKGCGRSWGNNIVRPPSGRGTPGVFTNVRLLLPWIKRKLREADEQQHRTASSRLCSVRDGPVSDSKGLIRNPSLPDDHYDNNELCLWSISAPPGYSVLLEFEHFDVENDSSCRYDQLTVSAGADKLVGIFCGAVHPGLVLLNQNVTLVFSSDVSRAGSGFAIRHHTVQEHSDPGCRAIVLVEDQSVIHSPNYPQSYSNNCVFRWVIYAPSGHIVKLDFLDMDLEESNRCLYDSLTVLGDVEQTEEIAMLCGGSVPPAVLSYHNIMVLRFTSDGSITQRGFRAMLTFISHSDLYSEDTPGVEHQQDIWTSHQDAMKAKQQHKTSYDPEVQQPSRRTMQYQGDEAQKTPQGPRMHTDMPSDDEDNSGGSSGADG